MKSQRHYCPPERRKYVLITAIFASAMGFIDFSVVAVALPQIRTLLDANFSQAQWISNAYMLFLSALILLGGALGDRFGLKFVFGLGIGFFSVTSLACALAWNAESLIIFRALQGAAAAVMIPGSMAIISINTPRAERGRALGLWVAASSITTSLGPLIGGIVLTYGGEWGWRLIFAINVPLGALTIFILWRFVPKDLPRHAGGLMSLDWTGALLLTLSLGLIAGGLTYLGELNAGGWAMTLLGAGVCLAGLGIFWEWRHRDPMVNLRLFRFTRVCRKQWADVSGVERHRGDGVLLADADHCRLAASRNLCRSHVLALQFNDCIVFAPVWTNGGSIRYPNIFDPRSDCDRIGISFSRLGDCPAELLVWCTACDPGGGYRPGAYGFTAFCSRHECG